MKLIVAEKPKVAQVMAKVLGANSRQNGYFENSEYQVSWCFGHLVGLAQPEDYDESYKVWSAESLPIIPGKMKLKVIDDSGARNQFKVLKGLMTKAELVICATDNDREGDLIFHYVYALSGVKRKYVRVLPNDLSEQGLRRALREQIEPRNLVIKQAECRSKADWLVGMNGSRAVSVASGDNISIGRVQTPVLGLVAKRFLINRDFKAKDYYPVYLELEKSGKAFKAKRDKAADTQQEAESIIASLDKSARCIDSEIKQVNEAPPLPYYLSTLQVDVANKHGLSVQGTLDIAQSLYEKHQLTTYPRTDSGYLTTELFKEVPVLLGKIFNLEPFNKYEGVIDVNELPRNCINDQKAPNHHGIIPTGDFSGIDNLSTDEKKVFEMIVQRFIVAFSPTCRKEKTRYIFECGSSEWVGSGTVIKEKGWRMIVESSDSGRREDEEKILPNVEKDEVIELKKSTFEKSWTKAPTLLTQATLLESMKSCGKNLDDEEMRKAMRDNELRTGGFGTEATRANAIESLFRVGLIMEKGKKIIPTEKGLSLHEQIKDMAIASPVLTAQWEMKLYQVASGDITPMDFMRAVEIYTKQVTADLLAAGEKVDIDNLKLSCPKCGAGKIQEKQKAYGCSRYQQGCDFVIWKLAYGKKVSPALVRELVQKGTTSKRLKGLKLRDSEDTFEAFLVLDEQHKLRARTSSGQTYKCPLCEGKVSIRKAGAFCECKKLKLFRNKGEKELSDNHLVQLLTKGQTGLIKGFKSEKGNSFDSIVIIENGSTGFKFPARRKKRK